MAELDGVWLVERVGGLLPPLHGVRKEIGGGRGVTRLGSLPGVPFQVVGRALRYRFPLRCLVDMLEPEGDGWRGRTLLLGRQLGTFRMIRAD